MGAVVEAIVDTGSDIVEAAGDVVSDIGEAVVDVGQAVGDVAQAIIEDPIPTLVTVAAAAVGVPPPLTAAAITAARGGSIEDIALSATASYAGGQVSQFAGQALSGAEPVVRDIVGGTLSSGTQAAITGGDIGAAALGGGVGSGVARGLTPTVGSATARAIGQTAGGITAGVDPARAAAAGIAGAGMSQLSGAAKDIYQAVTRGNEPITAGTEFAPLASGGVMSDVSPTPLVRLPERQGTVTVQQDFTPMPSEGMGGEGLPAPQLSDFEEAEYQEQLRRADEIVRQQQQQTQTQYQPILSPVDQQVFNLLASGMGLRSKDLSAKTGGATKTPAEQARELATGFVTQRGTGSGGRQAQEGGVSGESMMGGMGGEGTGGEGAGDGTQTIQGDGMTIVSARAPAERTATRMTRTAGGIPQADSMLGALLGTALTPAGSSEPIMGEDESQRRAVWNLESLRNALGI
jgi:hypothetical protein